MKSKKEEMSMEFAAVGGTFVDFQKIDLSPWGIQGGFVESHETKKFIRSISVKGHDEENWNHVKYVTQGDGSGSGMHGDWEHMNLLWPLDFNNPPTEYDYFDAIEAIRVIHPSEIYLRNRLGVQFWEGDGIIFEWSATYNTFHWHKYVNREEHYFDYPEENLKKTNEFLAYYKAHYNKRDYILNAIRYYSDSFRVNNIEMSFICLCICLETIIPGKEQLSYRFKRNLSVLCSDTVKSGQAIYKNANQLYTFRSMLVHSGMTRKNFLKFDLYFEYAQMLASRMIIEMLLHDIPSIVELDQKITELGFGQKKNISENYEEFKGNISTLYNVSKYEL